jgi:hypothetical protein
LGFFVRHKNRPAKPREKDTEFWEVFIYVQGREGAKELLLMQRFLKNTKSRKT